MVYRARGESRKAIEYYDNALKIEQETEDRLAEGIHLGYLGLACSDLGEPRKATEYLEKALKIAQYIEDSELINEINLEILKILKNEKFKISCQFSSLAMTFFKASSAPYLMFSNKLLHSR